MSCSCVIISLVMKMKIDRLIGILTILLQNEKTTAPELARHFEVSRRTILRDIDALAMAGIPITATRGADGGIAIIDGYKINKGILTSDELQNLVAALKSLDSVSSQSNFTNIMAKLAPGNSIVSLADSIVIDLSSHYKDSLSEKIELFKRAIYEHKTVRFDYYYSKGEITREIEPYFIQFIWSTWYIFGWCNLRNDFRQFKLNRLWNPSITDITFIAHPIPNDRASSGYATPEPYNIKILFDKSVRFRLIEEYGLNSYEETDTGLLLSLDYTNKEYIFSWILAFGDKAEVLEPKESRDEFARLAKNISERYE